MMANQVDVALILAAGEGTRMKSQTPKVLHSIAGRSLLGHILAAVSEVSPRDTHVVVGSGREMVENYLRANAPTVKTVHQSERKGTGHAVLLALNELPTDLQGNLMVLAGDTPLLRGETLAEFLAAHQKDKSSVSVLTAELPDPTGYGRIIREDDGRLTKIVEERDADDIQREIDEVNTGVYLFDIASLRRAITELSDDNSQGELYLTDAIEVIISQGGRAKAVLSLDFTETLGINDRSQLAECGAIMRDRINDMHMRNGVTIVDPTTTWIDVEAKIGVDVTIYPGSWIRGSSEIKDGAIVGPRSTIIDSVVHQGASVVESQCSGSIIGPRASVGPFSYLRPGTQLAEGAKVGAYVEMKNAQVGEGSKVPHLSYVGDAIIGRGTNIGAATIFVNYDGVNKYQTIVGDEVRIGSDSMLVAPVTIGDGAYTAAGSVITEDVPPGAMGVARERQRNILGWVLRKRSGTSSEIAARKAGAKE